MADLGVISLAKKVAPDVAIHVSTQANTVNIEDVKFWRDYGAKRVVLATGLSCFEHMPEQLSALPRDLGLRDGFLGERRHAQRGYLRRRELRELIEGGTRDPQRDGGDRWRDHRQDGQVVQRLRALARRIEQ